MSLHRSVGLVAAIALAFLAGGQVQGAPGTLHSSNASAAASRDRWQVDCGDGGCAGTMPTLTVSVATPEDADTVAVVCSLTLSYRLSSGDAAKVVPRQVLWTLHP